MTILITYLHNPFAPFVLRITVCTFSNVSDVFRQWHELLLILHVATLSTKYSHHWESIWSKITRILGKRLFGRDDRQCIVTNEPSAHDAKGKSRALKHFVKDNIAMNTPSWLTKWSSFLICLAVFGGMRARAIPWLGRVILRRFIFYRICTRTGASQYFGHWSQHISNVLRRFITALWAFRHCWTLFASEGLNLKGSGAERKLLNFFLCLWLAANFYFI